MLNSEPQNHSEPAVLTLKFYCIILKKKNRLNPQKYATSRLKLHLGKDTALPLSLNRHPIPRPVDLLAESKTHVRQNFPAITDTCKRQVENVTSA